MKTLYKKYEMLSAYVDDELSDTERKQIEDELKFSKELQEKLAELAGLHRAYIGQIERGEKNIGLRNLEKIAKALKVDIRVLVDTSTVGR